MLTRLPTFYEIDRENEPADMKVLRRLIRKIKQHNWVAYEGYSLNTAGPGSVLVHLRAANNGRQSILITPTGALHWFTEKGRDMNGNVVYLSFANEQDRNRYAFFMTLAGNIASQNRIPTDAEATALARALELLRPGTLRSAYMSQLGDAS